MSNKLFYAFTAAFIMGSALCIYMLITNIQQSKTAYQKMQLELDRYNGQIYAHEFDTEILNNCVFTILPTSTKGTLEVLTVTGDVNTYFDVPLIEYFNFVNDDTPDDYYGEFINVEYEQL